MEEALLYTYYNNKAKLPTQIFTLPQPPTIPCISLHNSKQ